MNTLGKVFAFLCCLALVVFISFFAAIFGSVLGGLKEGGWNWQFLVPMMYGPIAGLLLFITLFALLHAWRDNFGWATSWSFFGTLVLVFLGFFVGYGSITLSDKYAFANTKALVAEIQQHPEHFEQLLQKAKSTSLSDSEYSAFTRLLKVDRFLTEAQIDPVINLLETTYFYAHDGYGWNICDILEHQPVSVAHIQKLYDRHQAMQGQSYGRDYAVLKALQKHPKTPEDLREKIEARFAPKPPQTPSSPTP